MKKTFILFLILTTINTSSAQSGFLKSARDIDPCILGCDDEVTSVQLVTETNQGFEFEVLLKGFDTNKYVIEAKILNSRKKLITEFKKIKMDMPNHGGSVSLDFEFNPKSRYRKDHVATSYLLLRICKASDPLCDLDLGEMDITGTTYLYHLKKKIEIEDCSDCPDPITKGVKLIPFKSAKTIKP